MIVLRRQRCFPNPGTHAVAGDTPLTCRRLVLDQWSAGCCRASECAAEHVRKQLLAALIDFLADDFRCRDELGTAVSKLRVSDLDNMAWLLQPDYNHA